MSDNNLALLAAAAYGNLNDIKNEDSIHKVLKNEEIIKEYVEKFTDSYEIIAHQPNTASGYSGTIVKNRHSGEYFVLHRGTEDRTDLVEDLVLATKGIPENQIQDAKRFVDNAIRTGVIRGRFTNVGHSLGKSIADLIHFTTDLSKGSIGFRLYH